jgi:hypothetical protein
MGEQKPVLHEWGEVQVPDMAAPDLTRFVVDTLRIERVHPDYRRWNYDLDAKDRPMVARGQRFWCLVWTPEAPVSSREVRRVFRTEGFIGCVAAYHALLLRELTLVNVACLPKPSACLRNGRGGSFAPCLMQGNDQSRTLFARWTAPSWNEADPLHHSCRYTLVAFRPFE